MSQITASGISDASAVEVRHDFVNMWNVSYVFPDLDDFIKQYILHLL